MRPQRSPGSRTTLALPVLALRVALAAAAQATDFSVVVLPDTQNYSESYPEVYDAQTQWIVDHLAAREIRFVTHLGDLVNEAATLAQWQNAFASMGILDDAGVPYGTATGNHDFLYPGDFYDPAGTNYLAFFSPTRYENEPWWGGSSPSGLSNYQILEVDGREYLFLHLALETPAAELAFAQGVLNAHQDKPTWVSTHRYLSDWTLGGAFPIAPPGRYDDFNYFFEPLYRHDGIKAEDFFANFVAPNRQIYLVTCGHNHAEYRQTSQNGFGLDVHEVLADYQDEPNGGDGWLRVATLKPDAGRIDFETYSPTRDEFRTSAISQFSLEVDFDAYPLPPGERGLAFAQGVAGYDGALDTWVGESDANASHGASTTLVVDDDTENSLSEENEAQALLRFGELFGPPRSEADPPPAWIPEDATIQAASLILHLSDDEALGDTTIRVYRMSVGWGESSSWNSLGQGVDPEADTAGQVGSFQSRSSDGDSRTIDVTSAVSAWQAGAANHGFALIRDATGFNDDGIEIRSGEDPSSALRPKLQVRFSYPAANVAPSVTQSLSAVPQAVDEGSEVELVFAATDPNPLDPLVFRIEGQDVGFGTGRATIRHRVLLEDEGVYSFSASVRDDEATVPAGSASVAVRNVAPVIFDIAPDRVVDVGRVFPYWVDAVDPGILDAVHYAWDLDGDGQRDDGDSRAGEAWQGAVGVYDLEVQVRDEDGGASLAGFRVTAVELPADGDFDGDGSAIEGGAIDDAEDAAALAFCRAGPGALPAPPAPYAAQNCLSAFDADDDGDVDSADVSALLDVEPPVAVPVGRWSAALISLALCWAGARALRRLG